MTILMIRFLVLCFLVVLTIEIFGGIYYVILKNKFVGCTFKEVCFMSKDNNKKEYKTGQIQDNGLMYDPVYDFNKDGKIDLVEDSIRRDEIKKSQERWNESHQENNEAKQSSPRPQATGTDGFGCVGILLIIFFCIMGIALCFGAENDLQKALYIFGGLALALISGRLCGLFGSKEKDDKKLDVIKSAATKVKQKAEYDGKRKTIAKVIGAVIVITAVILLFNIGNIKNAHYYHQAIGFVNEGKYDEARTALNEIKDYPYKEKSEIYSFSRDLERFEKEGKAFGPDGNFTYYSFDFKFSDDTEKKKVDINKYLEGHYAEIKEKADKNFYDSIWNKPTEKETTTKKTYSGSSSYKSKKKSKSIDTYDVNDYSNEEDFYDDHYDDFMDYYEAEDYYNEHHD